MRLPGYPRVFREPAVYYVLITFLQRASTCAQVTLVRALAHHIIEMQALRAITEDAPAPSALHSFKAEVKDGKIHVTADPSSTTSANKSRPPKLLATGSEVPAGQAKGVVIVGGGSGAFMCIESLREVRNEVIACYLAG